MAPYRNTRSKKAAQVTFNPIKEESNSPERERCDGSDSSGLSSLPTPSPPPEWDTEGPAMRVSPLSTDESSFTQPSGSRRLPSPSPPFEGDAGPPDTRGLPLSSDGKSVTQRGHIFSWVASSRRDRWRIKNTHFGMDSVPIALDWERLPPPSALSEGLTFRARDRGLKPTKRFGWPITLQEISRAFIQLLRSSDAGADGRGIGWALNDEQLQTVAVSLMCIIQRTDPKAARATAYLTTGYE